MEGSGRSRCNSLDTASVLNAGEYVALDPEGSDPLGNVEPTAAEVAQCEAEVGVLLSIIAELSKKMGSLKAPSDPGDMRPPRPSRPLVPDILSHRLLRSSPERNAASICTSKQSVTEQGGGSVFWMKLQEVLSSVEDSISFKRTWAAPITASDQNKHTEHLKAAQETWNKTSQILEEMERDFGISPKEQHLEDLLHKYESAPTSSMLSLQEELQRAQPCPAEEAKPKLAALQRSWRSSSYSPSHRPPLSPDRAPPSYPGSPLLQRRMSRLSGDGSTVGSVSSSSACSSPVSLEPETEQLNRYIERLKARNERLTTALERRKSETDQMNRKLIRLDSDCSALQLALRNSEECEKAYRELLLLYEAKKQQKVLCSESTDGAKQTASSSELLQRGNEELSTSFSTAGDAEEKQSTDEALDQEGALWQQIERLKQERETICLPKPAAEAECKASSESAHSAGTRWGHVTRDAAKAPDTQREIYELISVRKEMSDLRALIRLKEKQMRCLEWNLMGQKFPEAAGVFIPESLLEQVDDRRAEQQRFGVNSAHVGCDGEIPGPLSRPILKELQSVLQSKALSSYRHIRRKYREQLWKVAAMMESQSNQSEAVRAAEAVEWKREETVL